MQLPKQVRKYKLHIVVAGHIAAILYILNYLTFKELPVVGISTAWGVVTFLGASLYIFYNLYHKRLLQLRQQQTPSINLSEIPEVSGSGIEQKEEPVQPKATQQPKLKPKPKEEDDILSLFKKGQLKIRRREGDED